VVEIPSDQDSWLGEVDHAAAYEDAGLETEESDGDGTEQSASSGLLERLDL
jgi:hypothetical protein